MKEKVVELDGYKFIRDEKTDYFLSSKAGRLHKYVWSKYNGDVPKGYDIHHKDFNKLNNNITNLECIERCKHMSLHAAEHIKDPVWMENRRCSLVNNARPKASEWHGSEEGIKWHSEHAKRVHANRIKEKFACKQCGKEFEAFKTHFNDFCTNACKSAHRRKSGVDNEKRICAECGKDFMANKYGHAKFCSTQCSHDSRRCK